jgi:hypothetical protein
MSHVNENLVAKVWEATGAVNKATKKNKQLQQQHRVSTLSKSTAASRASAAMAPRVGTGGSISSRRAGNAAEAATATARKKKKATSGSGTTKAATTTRTSPGNNMELLRNANLGKYEIVALLCGRSDSMFPFISLALAFPP